MSLKTHDLDALLQFTGHRLSGPNAAATTEHRMGNGQTLEPGTALSPGRNQNRIRRGRHDYGDTEITGRFTMNMVDKCRKAVKVMAQKEGNFTLFALLENDLVLGKWDMLFSAQWLRPGRAAIKTIVDNLAPELTPHEWASIANIIPLAPSMPYVQWIAQHYEADAESEVKEIQNVLLDGVFVSHGYIIAAKGGQEKSEQSRQWGNGQIGDRVNPLSAAPHAPRRRVKQGAERQPAG